MMESGIYMIKNMVNGKFYIGSSVNIKSRFRGHRRDLNNNKHHSILLQRSWNKYNKENFEFIIIQYCNPEDCIKNEQWWFDTLKPELNILKVAGSCLGWSQTKEGRRRIEKRRRKYMSLKHRVLIQLKEK